MDWPLYGLQPRWFGTETSDCAAALEPGFFRGSGHDELGRFFAGAERRGEIALVVSLIGRADGSGGRHPLSTSDASVHIRDIRTSVAGRRTPTGSRVDLAPDLGAADRDLALRLRNRPVDAPWWSLRLLGATMISGDGSGVETTYVPEGRLDPLLVNALGEPVAAVWVSAADNQRWYILPDGTEWNTVLDWLVQKALPEYVPAVLRRVRSPLFIDPDLQTDDELTTRQELATLEADCTASKLQLEQQLHDHRQLAEPIRQGLLFGSGTPLVDAVHKVLSAAGLEVLDLDRELGATSSADLLVGIAGTATRRLVEIKGSSGNAPEKLVSDLERHLSTWPQLRPNQPAGEGVLIVNHQHKLDPSERDEQIYNRKEFVSALKVTVLSTRALFDWWRIGNWEAIRSAVLGARQPAGTSTPADAVAATPPMSSPTKRRPWFRGRN